MVFALQCACLIMTAVTWVYVAGDPVVGRILLYWEAFSLQAGPLATPARKKSSTFIHVYCLKFEPCESCLIPLEVYFHFLPWLFCSLP